MTVDVGLNVNLLELIPLIYPAGVIVTGCVGLLFNWYLKIPCDSSFIEVGILITVIPATSISSCFNVTVPLKSVEKLYLPSVVVSEANDISIVSSPVSM